MLVALFEVPINVQPSPAGGVIVVPVPPVYVTEAIKRSATSTFDFHAAVTVADPPLSCPQFDWRRAGFATAVAETSMTTAPRRRQAPRLPDALVVSPPAFKRKFTLASIERF